MQPATSPFDVALSFAGEDRAHALALATRLRAAGYGVFFDRFEELWGQDLSVKLHEVYSRSRYCVVFVSESYLRKPWTNHERQILVARALRQAAACVLPIRIDDAELPGLPDVIAYKDLREESLDAIFVALCRLLGEPPAPGSRAPLQLYPSDFFYVVVQQDSLYTARFNLGCHLVNRGDGMRRLQRLEATLVPEGQCGVQFMAHLLYELDGTRRTMQRSNDTLPLGFASGESRLHGVQFVGPRIEPSLVWRAGTHTLEIIGWVDAPARRRDPDLHSRFALRLSPDDPQRLAPWYAVAGPVRAALPPAVAVPIAIDSPTRPPA